MLKLIDETLKKHNLDFKSEISTLNK